MAPSLNICAVSQKKVTHREGHSDFRPSKCYEQVSRGILLSESIAVDQLL